MALAYDGAIQRLIDSFASLPGIGPKGAQRIAFYLLQAPDVESQRLVDAINEVKEKVRFCEVCGNVCESSPCTICSDPRRDHSTICVVEEPKDVMSIERTREYRGLYLRRWAAPSTRWPTLARATSTSRSCSTDSTTARSRRLSWRSTRTSRARRPPPT